MIKSTKSIYIDAPVERVFQFLQDTTNWGALAPRWLDVTYEPVDIAPDGTGTFSYRGRAFRVIDDSGSGDVTEVIPNDRLVFRDDDPFQGTYAFLFERVGAGMTLTVVNEREASRVERIPVVGRFAGWLFGQHDDQMLRNVKIRMEQDHRV